MGWKSIWIASACAVVASVFAASGYFIRLTIWLGTNSPWRVSSVRIVLSVIEPAPSCPAIGMPLTAEMSTAPPVSAPATRPAAVDSLGPRCSACTVGFRPLRERKASTASTRLSIAPEEISWRARASRSMPGIGQHRQLELALGEQEHVARGGPEQGGSAPSLPADAAPRRAPSSSRAPAGDRSIPRRPRAAPRSADDRLSRPSARARGRAPCPRRRAIRAAAAGPSRSPWPAWSWSTRAAAASASGLPGWANSRTLPVAAGTDSAEPAGIESCELAVWACERFTCR